MQKPLLKTILILLVLVGCTEKTPEIAWDYSDKDVISAKTAKPESININIFLDATTSMKGYTSNVSGIYNKFLEGLESSVTVGWKTADVHFYKFGTKFKEIDRSGFKSAGKSQTFYSETGIFEKTNIDAVIDRMDSSQVNVIVTDLFQNEGDVNSIVMKIKERCFAKGIYLGILGIKSDYDGMVYDAKVPPYPFKSKVGDETTFRPFYVLIFGDSANIGHLLDSIKSNPSVKEENFILISPYIVNKYDIHLTKSTASKNLIARKSERNRFNFTLKKVASAGVLTAEISFDRNTRTPGFSDKIELVAYKKAVLPGQKEAPKDGAATQDISLKDSKTSGNKIQTTLNLSIADPEGTYSYLVYLQPASIGGFTMPQWIHDFSSDNPTPKQDANKTLNLEKFVSDLIRANSLVYQPKVAKFFVTVKKL